MSVLPKQRKFINKKPPVKRLNKETDLKIRLEHKREVNNFEPPFPNVLRGIAPSLLTKAGMGGCASFCASYGHHGGLHQVLLLECLEML